jgi:hypothetical protein
MQYAMLDYACMMHCVCIAGSSCAADPKQSLQAALVSLLAESSIRQRCCCCGAGTVAHTCCTAPLVTIATLTITPSNCSVVLLRAAAAGEIDYPDISHRVKRRKTAAPAATATGTFARFFGGWGGATS